MPVNMIYYHIFKLENDSFYIVHKCLHCINVHFMFSQWLEGFVES